MTDIHPRDRACQSCHRIRRVEDLEVEWKNGYRRWVCAGGCGDTGEALAVPKRPVAPAGDEKVAVSIDLGIT